MRKRFGMGKTNGGDFLVRVASDFQNLLPLEYPKAFESSENYLRRPLYCFD
jgi:hypothetical protein